MGFRSCWGLDSDLNGDKWSSSYCCSDLNAQECKAKAYCSDQVQTEVLKYMTCPVDESVCPSPSNSVMRLSEGAQ